MYPDIFCSYRPAPPLDRFIEHLWYWDGQPPSHARDRLMPTGGANLIINLVEDEVRSYDGQNDECLQRHPGAVLVGAYSKYSVIDTREQRAVLGVSFRPGGMMPFFEPAADELHNTHVSLRDLWHSAGETLRERVLAAPTPYSRLRVVEAELLSRALRRLHRRPEVEFTLAQLTHRQDCSIATLSEQTGLSARRMTRLFTLEVGLTPKLYARVKRFGRMTRLMGSGKPSWADLAQQLGYFDQSHLIRDCKEISGFTPSELQARWTGHGNHVAV